MRAFLLLAAAIGGLASAGILVAPAASLVGRAPVSPADSERNRSLVTAQNEATRARARADALDRQARAATQASERATIEAAALAARIETMEADLAQVERSLALARAQRRGLDTRLAAQRQPVTGLMAGLQGLSRRPALLTLAQPGSIADAVHLRAVAAALGQQIDSRTARLRTTLAQARALETTVGRAAIERRQLQSELAQRRSELATVAEAERLKARRAAGAADGETERALAISAKASSLSALVRGVSQPAREQRVRVIGLPATGGPAPYRLPVRGKAQPTSGDAIRGFTVVPDPGAIVVAPGGGRVAFAGPYRGYGFIVIVDHGAEWMSLVTGLAGVRVTVGQTLIAGSPLGQAPTRAPRIGLELRKGAKRVDPLDQLR